MSLDANVRARIETLLQNNAVVLFMKGQPSMPQCGFSAKAVGILSNLGVNFAHVNVLDDAEIREGIKIYGQWPTIPQLYIQGELVGGSDIMIQMANNGQLSELLNLPPIDKTPPQITITDNAAEMLRTALDDAGDGMVLSLSISPQFQANFQISGFNPDAITSESNGLKVQFDIASLRRADGIVIDWIDDMRGRGLSISNPNAPIVAEVKVLTPSEAKEKTASGEVILVDVRPADERQMASVSLPFKTFDNNQRSELEALPKNTPLAFLCRSGGRSLQAAEGFLALGFTTVYNVEGGINAWAKIDSSMTAY